MVLRILICYVHQSCRYPNRRPEELERKIEKVRDIEENEIAEEKAINDEGRHHESLIDNPVLRGLNHSWCGAVREGKIGGGQKQERK